MQTNLFFQRILMIFCIVFSLKSFGKTIVMNINNGNPDASLYEMNENAAIGDKIHFTNNLNYALTPNDSHIINAAGNFIPINIQPGEYYEVELTSQTQTQFTFFHMDLNQNTTYMNRINLTFNALGVNETLEKSSGKMKIFPNPCKDVLYIKSQKNIKDIILFDASGKLLLIKKTMNSKNNDNESMNMSLYPRGKYFLQVKNSEGTLSTINVIKE